MNRQIKFRAWNKARGGWVNSLVLGKMHVNSIVNSHINSIIEQFTGLKDKKGTDIYESDLCLINGVIYRIEYIQDFMTFCPFRQHEWEWFKEGNNHFKYCYESSHLIEGTIHFLSQLESYEIEVIGNIHDNPELLQGKGDE